MIQFTKTKKFNYIIVNKNTFKKPKHGVIVPIHRPSPSGLAGSPLGNPFILKDVNDDVRRDKVCDDYERWIIEKINNKDGLVLNELQRIKDLHDEYGIVYLQCFCTPKRCHGETIIKILKGEIK